MPTFYKSVAAVAAAATLGDVSAPNTLDISNSVSIKSVASTLAWNSMSYYDGNLTTTAASLGDLPEPYYWWEAGLLWGSMIDYYHYTGDPTYNDNLIAALTSPLQTGANLDFMPDNHAFEEGNDDLGFWGYAVLGAAEINLPQPNPEVPSWLDLAVNIFNSLLGRWDNANCGGGLLWQIYASNPNGMTYKNSVSNGGFFHLAARLYRATGNQTYLDWAHTVYDWTAEVGLLSHEYRVYDGTQITACKDVNKLSFTYSHGIYMYGAAVLANATGDQVWLERTSGLVDSVTVFFSPYDNATDVMYEPACETVGTCNVDMKVHKATLARFMWKTAAMVPATADRIRKLLRPSAEAAVATCTGGRNGKECGMRWYVGGHDGQVGLGQNICAMEVVHGLLAHDAPAPLRGDDIKVVREKSWESQEQPAGGDGSDDGDAEEESPATRTRARRSGVAAGAALSMLHWVA